MLRIIDQYRFDSTDPFYGTVVQHAHLNGPNGSTTLTNSCPRGNTLTAHATAASLDTSDFVFGPSSLHRNGGNVGNPSAGTVAHADYQFANADFTIEFRVKVVNTFAAINIIFDMRAGGSDGNRPTIYFTSTGALVYYTNSTVRITSAAGVIANSTWADVCYSRVSGTGRLFRNGAEVGSWADTINYNVSAEIDLGGVINANPTNVFFDEVRVSNGIYGAGAGRYAASYTIATEAFPDS